MQYYGYALNALVLDYSLIKILLQKAIFYQYKRYEPETIGVVEIEFKS